MAVGSVVTLGTMIVLEINAEAPLDGIYANEPIYYGLVGLSRGLRRGVAARPSPRIPQVMRNWHRRVAGQDSEDSGSRPGPLAALTAPAGAELDN